MDAAIEVPIFIDTNLGTHIALSVPPCILARDFKKQLETTHLKCFPELEEIEVYGLMVKRKSRFYCLPDSIPIKLAFEGVRGTWFLHVEARASAEFLESYSFDSVTEDINDRISIDSDIIDPLEPENCFNSDEKSDEQGERKESREKESRSGNPSLVERTNLVYVSKKKKKRKKKRDDEDCFLDEGLEASVLPTNSDSDHRPQTSRSMTDVPSGMFSEVKSVTSIIKRYFLNSAEKTGLASPTSSDVTSKLRKTKKCCSRSSGRLQVRNRPNIFPLPLPLPLPLRRDHAEQPVNGHIDSAEVGERLVTATNNLGLSSCKKKSVLHRSKAPCLIKLSVFEISDSDY